MRPPSPSCAPVGDDPDVDARHPTDQLLGQRLAQPGDPGSRRGLADQHVRGPALGPDRGGDLGDVVALLDHQPRAEDRGQLAQSAPSCSRSSAERHAPGGCT